MYKKCEEILNKLESEGKIKISNYQFPPKQELKLKLKDMLEDEVDEKYYLSDKMINFFYKNEQVQKEKGNGFRFNVTDGNVIAKTITTRAGSRMDDNFLKIKEANEPMIYDDRDKGWGVKITDICPTQRASRSGIKCIQNDLRIRKLTPKECWRLMGFDDEEFEKASKVNSNTQLYKQAGNSIVVNVLEAILSSLL